MLQRRAMELLNCSVVCLIGYYLADILGSDAIPKEIRLEGFNFKAWFMFLILMVFIFLTMQQITMCMYKRIKTNSLSKELQVRKQFVVLDQLENQTRSGLINDPYTQALQQIIITEALTPSSKRKERLLKETYSADSLLLNTQKSPQAPRNKLWSSLRKTEKPVATTVNAPISSAPATPKLNRAPPPPPPGFIGMPGLPMNRAPMAPVHIPQRKLSTKSVGANVQKRIEALRTLEQHRGYENPALSMEEQTLKKKERGLFTTT